MWRFFLALSVAAVCGGFTPLSAQAPASSAPQAAASAFDRLKAMEGEWIDLNGAFGKKGAVVATYRVTGAGNTVIETFPVGTPHEMTTVYHRDGSAILLTHFCAGGTQPRMRAKTIDGNRLSFEFDGGSNIDVATTSHMHNMHWEFVSNDEVKAAWHNWSNGKDDGHVGAMHIRRKK